MLTWSYQSVSGLIYYLLGSTEIVRVAGSITVSCVVLGHRFCHFYLKRRRLGPPVGDFLGELTNELEKGDWITEFVCNGPKNYVYQTHAGKRVCKVKGFSLNFENAQKINLKSMRDAMFNREDLHTGVYHTLNSNKICREKVHSELYTREEISVYETSRSGGPDHLA